MNKLLISNGKIDILESDGKISISFDESKNIYDISKLVINVNENTVLVLKWCGTELDKCDVLINIENNVECNIYEIKNQDNIKIQYKYCIKEYSLLNIHKCYDCKSIKELDIVHLNGVAAKINYNYCAISTEEQNYNLFVYHNASQTSSSIKINGVNLKQNKINITGVVDKGMTNCEISQNVFIVTNDALCNIEPNLVVDEEVLIKQVLEIEKVNNQTIYKLVNLDITDNDKPCFEAYKKFPFLEESKNIIDKYWR